MTKTMMMTTTTMMKLMKYHGMRIKKLHITVLAMVDLMLIRRLMSL